MFATTRQFLDYFNLQNLNELPPLSEIKNLEEAAQQLAENGATEGETSDSEAQEVMEVEEQTAEELFAELDEMESELPDNFDDIIKKQSVETLDIDTNQPEPEQPLEPESNSE